MVRALYESDAARMLDNDLLDDVAYRLFERCRDIVIVTNAKRGRATCPRCDSTIEHDGRARTLLVCSCGFEMRWRAYARTFRDPELWGGNAMSFFEAFVAELPAAQDPKAKLVAIDRVIHAMHITVRADKAGRAALNNVIEGTSAAVLELLETLAYGPEARRLRATKERWENLEVER